MPEKPKCKLVLESLKECRLCPHASHLFICLLPGACVWNKDRQSWWEQEGVKAVETLRKSNISTGFSQIHVCLYTYIYMYREKRRGDIWACVSMYPNLSKFSGMKNTGSMPLRYYYYFVARWKIILIRVFQKQQRICKHHFSVFSKQRLSIVGFLFVCLLLCFCQHNAF